ncbi:MAG: hypoxanthine phosphoribosyltransferase [Chthonomonas sp.]|nr:hypoxanthine phosphoribosyltransferase [Fimbriimonadaceae bacterium]
MTTLLTADAIQHRMDEMARDINAAYAGEPILAVCVLKGAFLFHADLVRRLVGEVAVDFIQVSSYGTEQRSSGIVQLKKDADTSFEDRNVLLVEDIVDTGQTLKHLRELFATRRPKSLRVAALLSKPTARMVEVNVDFLGFEIPNEFVVGYGLDSAEQYRNLGHIAVLGG